MNDSYQSKFEQLCAFVEGKIAKKGIPGVAVGLLYEDKTYTAGFGATNADHPLPVTDETLQDVTLMRVEAVTVPVLSATALMVHKLLTFNQQHCDYSKALPMARSLREQIDWDRVRVQTRQSPYAHAFLFLLELLNVLPVTRTEPS